MNKRMRVEYAGAVYHVIQRGNNKEFIFDREQDKRFLLSSMEQVAGFYEMEMLAYTIMGNHYHLVVRTGETGLGQVMHRLNTRYSVYYNHVKDRSGHVFQGRYQAILITNGPHLFTVVRYVHQNPVRAGICDRVEDYRWSSDSIYRGRKPSGFVNKDLLLNMMAVDENDATAAYVRFMDSAEPEEAPGDFQLSPPLRLPSISSQTQLPADPIQRSIPLDDILLAIVEDDETFRLIKSGVRRREFTDLKSAYIYNAIRHGHPLQHIAANINISKSAASQHVRRLSK